MSKAFSSMISTSWNLLSTIGDLPDEIILKILYEFNGLQHPIVKLLFNETKVDEWERLRKLPFSRSIQNHYYKHGLNEALTTLLNDKQNLHFIYNCSSYIHWKDPGYFIRRENGRLHYNLLNDNLTVHYASYMNLWKLDRSKKIIESIKCGCGKRYIYDFGSPNHLNTLLDRYGSYTYSLHSIKKNYNINKWLCNGCYNIGFNEWKPILLI
tara:strand:+ start:23 stop:655 length:633 start_codon:yes stop_codon:yes gene_type:complete